PRAPLRYKSWALPATTPAIRHVTRPPPAQESNRRKLCSDLLRFPGRGKGTFRMNQPAASVRGRLRDGHAEGDFQVVAIKRVDVDHPAECLLEHVPARGFALGGVGNFAGETEASVGQEAEALVDCGRGRTRRHWQHAGHVEM